MLSIYAHDTLGIKVYSLLCDDIKSTIKNYSSEFKLGLQGPVIFSYYKSFNKKEIFNLLEELYTNPMYVFLEGSRKTIKESKFNCREYAYLLGLICYFAFENYCGKLVNFDDFLTSLNEEYKKAYDTFKLPPITDHEINTISHVYSNYSCISKSAAVLALRNYNFYRKLYYVPNKVKKYTKKCINQTVNVINEMEKDILDKHDHCKIINFVYYKLYKEALENSVELIYDFHNAIIYEKKLNNKFNKSLRML